MRIVSIGPAPPWRGGIAHYHFALTRQLQTIGIEVELLTFARLYPRIFFPGSAPSDVSDSALTPLGEQILRPLWPPSWRRGATWTVERKPDAVILHWWHPFFAPAYLGVLRRVGRDTPVGFICHNVTPHERMPAGGILTRKVIRRGDFFITGGEDMARQVSELNRDAEIEVILHPRYDLPYTEQYPDREQARTILGLENDETIFLFFGLIREYKGLDILIEALSLLPAGESWTCLVAGEFYESKEPYEARIGELGLTDRIRVVDRYIPNNEVALYFSAADLTVLPYRQATQSGVAALSIAFNRPVLTTRVGALPEMITENENGWLVPPEDPEALSSLMSRICRDRQTARLPVIEGYSGLPDWNDLAQAVIRLVTTARES